MSEDQILNPLEPGARSRPARSAREQHAYRLIVIGGASALIGLVALVLALAGLIGFLLPAFSLGVVAVCVMLVRRLTAPHTRY